MREKLYAYRISNREISIEDVPAKYRNKVMALLTPPDRERQERILAEAD